MTEISQLLVTQPFTKSLRRLVMVATICDVCNNTSENK